MSILAAHAPQTTYESSARCYFVPTSELNQRVIPPLAMTSISTLGVDLCWITGSGTGNGSETIRPSGKLPLRPPDLDVDLDLA